MKKHVSLCTLLLAAIVIASCGSPLVNQPSSGAKDHGLTLTWDLGSNRSSTIMPLSTPSIASYDVILTPIDGGAAITKTALTTTSWTFEDLSPSTWFITVKAYGASGTLVATGSNSVNLAIPETSSCFVALYASTDGTSNGSYTITFDLSSFSGSITSSSCTLYGLDAGGERGQALAAPALLSLGGYKYQLGNASIPSGSYDIQWTLHTLINASDATLMGHSALIVTGGAVSAATFALQSSSFKQDWVDLESVTLPESAVTLPYGAVFRLQPTLSPAGASCKDIAWTISDSWPSMYGNRPISVDSAGNIASRPGYIEVKDYFLTYGPVTFTATSVDGGFTASVVVTGAYVKMVDVPGGSFSNGTGTSTVSAFSMATTEVTQALYKYAMVNITGSNTFAGDGLPSDGVSWYQAVALCNWLSQWQGLTPAYKMFITYTNPDGSGGTENSSDVSHWITTNGENGGIPTSKNAAWDSITVDLDADGYRLPTEAEWQWAAMGGTAATTKTYSGSGTLGESAWYSANAAGTTHAVGTSKANELGIYDMSGNVAEWCQDWYAAYPNGTVGDYTGPAIGTQKVLRGGAANSLATALPPGARAAAGPGTPSSLAGIRLVRSLTTSATTVTPHINLNSGMVGRWLADSGGQDVSGNGHNWTLSGTTLTGIPGHAGAVGARAFGANQYLDLGAGLGQDSAGEFTIAFWMNITSPSGVSNILNQAGAASELTYKITADQPANGVSAVFTNGGSDGFNASGGYAWTGGWHHFVVVVRNHTRNSYFDGSPVISSLFSPLSVSGSTPTGKLTIGNDTANASSMGLEDVRIYNRALSPAEAAALANP